MSEKLRRLWEIREAIIEADLDGDQASYQLANTIGLLINFLEDFDTEKKTEDAPEKRIEELSSTMSKDMISIPISELDTFPLEATTLAEALMFELKHRDKERYEAVRSKWHEVMSDIVPDSGRGPSLHQFLVELFEDCIGNTNDQQKRIEALKKALREFLDKYILNVSSGDWGNWDPEEETVVINARKALENC